MNAPESAQVGRPNLKATRPNVDALSKVRQNWYVYFRDGAFTFARYTGIFDTSGTFCLVYSSHRGGDTIASRTCHFPEITPSDMPRRPQTAVSWLPRTETVKLSWARCKLSTGEGPYPTMSPRLAQVLNAVGRDMGDCPHRAPTGGSGYIDDDMSLLTKKSKQRFKPKIHTNTND